MSHYRIVKFENGNYGIQEHQGFMLGWLTKFDEYETIEKAQEQIDRHSAFDKKWEARKKRKVLEVIG